MRTVAIRLGDNDFGTTFLSILETVNRAIKFRHDSGYELSPESVDRYIKEGIRFHYLAFQHRERLGEASSDTESDAEDVDRTVEYLKNNIQVLFDDEAEQYLLTNDYDHGAWYLEIQTGKSYTASQGPITDSLNPR